MTDEVQKKLDEAMPLGINMGNPAALSAFAQGDIKNFLAASTPGGIEAQEAAGASAMKANSRLPKSGLLERREALEKIGIVVGEEIDDVLVAVTLPEGWGLEGNNHHDARHMALFDDRGRQRAYVFIKVAFYDYTGYVEWNSAITVEDRRTDSEKDIYDEPEDAEVTIAVSVVKDGNVLHQTESVTTVRAKHYEAKQSLHAAAREWLDEHFPNHSDPFAYWDEEVEVED